MRKLRRHKQQKLQDDGVLATSVPLYDNTACAAFTSTPERAHQKPNITVADVSEISASEHEIGRMTEVEMSGIAVRKYSTKKAFDKSSSFINPFDLAITASEIMEHNLEGEMSDDDYEASLNWMLRMDHTNNIKDVYSEEEDTDDNEDTADEPEVELGPGVKRIRDNTDIDDMLDDTIFLVFSSQLMTLANTCMQKTCKVKGCKEEAVISQETVSSVVYFKWLMDSRMVVRNLVANTT